MSQIQGFFLKYRKVPEKILSNIDDLLNSDENVKISAFLEDVNCLDCLNDFKLEECYTLAEAKSLPKSAIQEITSKLSPVLQSRLI